jgi:hypothetical protein
MKRTPQNVLPPIVEIKLSSHLAWIKQTVEPGAKYYRMGECFIILGQAPMGWHMSISKPDRYPDWDEVAGAWYGLLDNIPGGLILPPKEAYVNISNFCFHVWQIEYTEDQPFKLSKQILIARS